MIVVTVAYVISVKMSVVNSVKEFLKAYASSYE